MNDLVTKENSFYSLFNEPFGDILKAYLIDGSEPAMLAMVADAPAPVDKEVIQIAKHIVQVTAQEIEDSGVSGPHGNVVATVLNEIDRQLKSRELSNGLLCCSIIFIQAGKLYIGGVGDCTIAISNDHGVLRFCYDSPNEPKPDGVEQCSVAPAEWIGLGPEARLGDMPMPYTEAGVYSLDVDHSFSIYMFSDGLTKHIPEFFKELMGRDPDEVFGNVSKKIPKKTEALLDDICFTTVKIPSELVVVKPKSNAMRDDYTGSVPPLSTVGKPMPKSEPLTASQPARAQSNWSFWTLFTMLLIIMVTIFLFGFWCVTEWLAFKSHISNFQ